MNMNQDRRSHKRLSLTLNIAEPMRLEFAQKGKHDSVPGILANISAGGMSLLVFSSIALSTVIKLDLEFMGIAETVIGKVVRIEERISGTYIIGIKFDNVIENLVSIIDDMAKDSELCEIRFLLKGDEACFPECCFRILCAKRIKREF